MSVVLSTSCNTGGTPPVPVQSVREETPLRGGSTYFGRVVQAVDDCDGDGLRDYAVGMPFVREGTGSVRVFSSRSHAALFDLRPTKPGNYTHLGCELASLSDIDGDGTDELAARRHDHAGTEIFSLRARRSILTMYEPPRSMGHAVGFSPSQVLPTCDIDGDGVRDLLACGAKVVAYSGRDGTALGSAKLAALQGLIPVRSWSSNLGARTLGLVRQGDGVAFFDCAASLEQPIERTTFSMSITESVTKAKHRFGATLDAVDLDGDGALDLIQLLMSGYENDLVAEALVLRAFGSREAGLLFERKWRADTEPESLVDCVGLPGDLNGDGTPDLIVGVPFAWGIPGGVFALSGADGSDLWRVPPPHAIDDPAGRLVEMGMTLGILDDVDGDHVRDLVVGCGDYHWGAGTEEIGIVLVLSGRTGAQLHQMIETEVPVELK